MGKGGTIEKYLKRKRFPNLIKTKNPDVEAHASWHLDVEKQLAKH